MNGESKEDERKSGGKWSGLHTNFMIFEIEFPMVAFSYENKNLYIFHSKASIDSDVIGVTSRNL